MEGTKLLATCNPLWAWVVSFGMGVVNIPEKYVYYAGGISV
jgi:hypothetical protein